MSDFSGMEQSFALPSVTPCLDVPRGLSVRPEARERSFDVQLREVEYRRLHDARDMHAIHRLRAEIQLPEATAADPGFRTREKKETRRGLSAGSSGMTSSSVR